MVCPICSKSCVSQASWRICRKRRKQDLLTGFRRMKDWANRLLKKWSWANRILSKSRVAFICCRSCENWDSRTSTWWVRKEISLASSEMGALQTSQSFVYETYFPYCCSYLGGWGSPFLCLLNGELCVTVVRNGGVAGKRWQCLMTQYYLSWKGNGHFL